MTSVALIGYGEVGRILAEDLRARRTAGGAVAIAGRLARADADVGDFEDHWRQPRPGSASALTATPVTTL